MIDPSVLRALQATGATVDMIIAAVEADALVEKQRLADRRAKDVVRQRKSRASRAVTVTPSDSADVVPNDIYSNPPEPSLSKDKPSPLPERVLSAWNAGPAKAGAREARPSGKPRANAIRLRVAEHGEAALFEMIANVAASDFHCGRGERGWRANLDWTLEPRNFQKMLELAPNPSAKPLPVYPPEYTAAVIALAAERDRKQLDMGEYLRRHSALRVQFGIDDGTKAQPPPERRGGGAVDVGALVKAITRESTQCQS